MPQEQVTVQASEGECPVHVFTPASGAGPWPGAIIYMDAFAIRPTLTAMAQRLADAGYVVLLPDLYYRVGGSPTWDPGALMAAGNFREVIGPYYMSTSPQKAAADTQALLAYLDTRADVTGKVGVVGYCMGGAMALVVAGTYSDRIGAAASFHGGNLANDTDASPHLTAVKAKAKLLVAGADQDAHYPPAMEAELDKALTEAGVDHRCEIWPGALHGWTMADLPVYNAAAAERHFDALIALFDEALK
jgi:carboxymethylenebutenolidase